MWLCQPDGGHKNERTNERASERVSERAAAVVAAAAAAAAFHLFFMLMIKLRQETDAKKKTTRTAATAHRQDAISLPFYFS